jgi:hypothetical protein
MAVEFAVQKAIDAVLVPALQVLAPPVPVYDHTPQDQPYPFVEYSRTIRTPDNLAASKMSSVQIALTVYSSYRGKKEVATILGAIEAVLDEATLTLDTGAAVRCDLTRSDIVRDADGVTYMGSALYTVLVDH